MTTTRSLCLALELHSDGERIAGRVRDRHGNEWPFASWLGLLTLIERLRASASSPTPNRSAKEKGQMANMTISDHNQMDRATLTDGTGVLIGSFGRRALAAYLVIASLVLGVMLVAAAQVFDGWHHIIVIADLLVVLFGVAAWAYPDRKHP